MKKKLLTIFILIAVFLFYNICYAEYSDVSYEYIRYSAAFRDMATSDDGTIAAVGTNGKICTCVNDTWNEIEYSVFDDINDIEYGNGHFYAISNSTVYSSVNGISWEIINNDLGAKNGGIFYFNGNQFVLERENISVNNNGMMSVKSYGVYVTDDFVNFVKVGASPTEDLSVSNDPFRLGNQYETEYLSIDDAFQILYGAGTTNSRNAHRKIEIFQKFAGIEFPTVVDDIIYFGNCSEGYEIFYITDYKLIRAVTYDFKDWDESIIELPDKSEYLSSADVIYNNGYYIKYDTNERYEYSRVKKCVYSANLTDYTAIADITEENGAIYSFNNLYIIKNNVIYKCQNSAVVQAYSIQNQPEKSTIKYSNGKYIKWVYDKGVQIYLSDDSVNWSIAETPEVFLTNRCNVEGDAKYDVIWDGANYLIRPTSCDNGYNPTGEAGCLMIFDSSLNKIKEVNFDNYILDMSYENGTYNILTNNDCLLHKSADLVHWQSEASDMIIKLSNNKTSISKQLNKSEAGYDITDSQIDINIKDSFKDIVFENVQNGDISVSGEYYIILNNETVALSDDGVYRHTIQLPLNIGTIKSVYAESGMLHVITSTVELIYDISDLYNETHTYVEVGGKILGFDVEPVIESGRTLVPMRFIFEQMGAEVDWNNITQTATVEKGNEIIVFSINNTQAKVNNNVKTMDVPARLINSKTMIPIRFLSEELGYTVEWDEVSRIVTINGGTYLGED